MPPDRGEETSNLLDRNVPTIPRTSLAQPALHDGAVRHLAAATKKLTKNEVWSDVALLERLHYKNKNQHRRGLYYQRLMELRRLLSKLKSLRVVEVLENLILVMKPPGAKKNDWKWDRTPYQDFVAKIVALLRQSASLISRIRTVCAQTYVAFRQLLSATLFMPFALVIMGMCSRIAALCKPWLVETRSCAEEITLWAKSLPLSSPDAVGVEELKSNVEDAQNGAEEMEDLELDMPQEADVDQAGLDEEPTAPVARLPEGFATNAVEAMELSESFFSSIGDSAKAIDEEDIEEVERTSVPATSAKAEKKKVKKKKKRREASGGGDEIDDVFDF